MIKFKSINTKSLNSNEILKILKIKDSYWKFGLKSQKKYFIENSKSNDIHNCLMYKNKLIGYNFLKYSYFDYKKKRIKYLHFDTLVIDKKFRGKKLSTIFMNYINSKIRKKRKSSILYCDKNKIAFYRRFNWKILYSNYELKIKRKKIKLCYNM